MTLSKYVIDEIAWLTKNIDCSFGYIRLPPIQIIIFSDVSPPGYGAAIGEISTNGKWLSSELKLHINIREILDAYFAIESFQFYFGNKHVKFMIYNTTAVAAKNHMGTNHSDDCNSSVVKLCNICVERNVWVTACHIPGKSNIADTDLEISIGKILNGY